VPLFAAKAPVSPWWRISHAASDASDLSIQQGFSKAANAIGVDPKKLRDEIARGRFARAADAFDWKGFERDLANELESRTMKAAEKSAFDTARRLGIPVPSNEEIRVNVRTRAQATAKQMAKESRNALKTSMRRLRKQQKNSSANTASIARKIAGLNRQQATSVVNRLGALDEATPFKRNAQANKIVRSGRRNRARLVSRHEGSTAAEDAQELTIRAAEQQGVIKEVFQRWVSIRDKRRDPICARLHGQRVRLGDSFTDPLTGKKYSKPPQPHAKCRCGRQYTFKKVTRRRAA